MALESRPRLKRQGVCGHPLQQRNREFEGCNLRKTSSKLALGLVVIIFIFAVASFLRENWGANETPGVVETFLAKWALSRARQSESDLHNPFQPTQENLEEGRKLYEKQCAFCHGQDGKGQGETGIQFYPPVPSLIDPQNERTDGQVHSIVDKGIRYTAMPSFAKELRADEMWKVVLWVRRLRQQPPPTEALTSQTPDRAESDKQ